MSIEENKSVIYRLTTAFWNEGNTAVIEELIATDFADHGVRPA